MYDLSCCNRISEWIARPLPVEVLDTSSRRYFDPWEALSLPLYGSYSSSFDQCAIQVLEGFSLPYGIRRDDLASEMFREMLCVKDLCDYGSSPRACFPIDEFKSILPDLISRWKVYYFARWGVTYVEDVLDA